MLTEQKAWSHLAPFAQTTTGASVDEDRLGSYRGVEEPTLIYLRIDEGPSGFGWQVRAYKDEIPVEQGQRRFSQLAAARDDGLYALKRLSCY